MDVEYSGKKDDGSLLNASRGLPFEAKYDHAITRSGTSMITGFLYGSERIAVYYTDPTEQGLARRVGCSSVKNGKLLTNEDLLTLLGEVKTRVCSGELPFAERKNHV